MIRNNTEFFEWSRSTPNNPDFLWLWERMNGPYPFPGLLPSTDLFRSGATDHRTQPV